MSHEKTFSEDVWQAELEARAEKASKEFKAFIKTVAQLRHPIRGCPWDLEQTHESLRRYMLEEAYEATETMVNEPGADLIDELGDVLLQVVLNSQLTADANRGKIDEVVKGINEKMIRRHPHVFAPTKEAISSDEVTEQWAKIKQKEKAAAGPEPVFKRAKKVHPALSQAFQIGITAKKIDFDWGDTLSVYDQVQSEMKELKVEIDRNDKAKIAEELSDCFFSLAQLSRHLGHEPEEIAQRGNLKFLSRFELMETIAAEEGLEVSGLGQAKLEELWSEAKARQKQKAKS